MREVLGLVTEDGQMMEMGDPQLYIVTTMEMTFVPEGDLYRLIMHSKLPSAERFESWVFDEVLPAIRRHGAYMTDSLLEQVAANPELILQLAQKLLEERQVRESMEHQLRAAQPKADYFDTFINPDGCTNIRNTAKELEIPEREFISYLLEHHYLYRDKQDQLMPYAAYTRKEYFYLRDFYKPNGVLAQQTMFTCRGKNHIRRLIKGKDQMKKRTMWTPLLAAAVFFMSMNPMIAMASGETEAGETAEEAEITVLESALSGILESDVNEADAEDSTISSTDETEGGEEEAVISPDDDSENEESGGDAEDASDSDASDIDTDIEEPGDDAAAESEADVITALLEQILTGVTSGDDDTVTGTVVKKVSPLNVREGVGTEYDLSEDGQSRPQGSLALTR